MEGTFFITLDYLKQLGACREGQREFQRVFPDGGEYQAILDRCADEGRLDFGSWLFNHIGATNDVRIYEEKIDTPNRGIIFAGDIKLKAGANIKFLLSGRGIKTGYGIEAGDGIKAGQDIEAGDGIKAGWGIEAGWGIKAGQDIEAGRDIEAGDGIKAGCGIKAGYGIDAGWGIKAGDGIKAGQDIEAGDGIKAGWGIKAGCGIKAGKDFCVFAGLNIKKSEWPIFAVVTAKEKPTNLISGYWKPIADGLFKENNL